MKKRFKVLLNAASNRSKKRISMYFHVKATRTNKGGEGIVYVNQTFYVGRNLRLGSLSNMRFQTSEMTNTFHWITINIFML